MSSEIAPDVLSSHSSSADTSSNQDIDGNIDQVNHKVNNADKNEIVAQGTPSMAVDHGDRDLEIETSETPALRWRDRLWLGRKLPLNAPKPAPQILQDLPLGWLILAVSVGGVVVTALWGLQYLTALESNPDGGLDCQSKITGEWQTPFGKLSLREADNQKVTGSYEYSNLDRGRVKGEFTGKLRNNVINFAWKEGADQQQGKGIFVFSEGCMEFFGSYGIADSTNNFGNWQGYRIKK